RVELDVEQHADAVRRPALEALDQSFLEAGRGELSRGIRKVGAHELAAAARPPLAYAFDERRHYRGLATAGDTGFHQAGVAARTVGRGDRPVLLDRVRSEVEAEAFALRRHLLGAGPAGGVGKAQRGHGMVLASEQALLPALALALRRVGHGE